MNSIYLYEIVLKGKLVVLLRSWGQQGCLSTLAFCQRIDECSYLAPVNISALPCWTFHVNLQEESIYLKVVLPRHSENLVLPIPSFKPKVSISSFASQNCLIAICNVELKNDFFYTNTAPATFSVPQSSEFMKYARPAQSQSHFGRNAHLSCTCRSLKRQVKS